jgi:hypothetical protein
MYAYAFRCTHVNNVRCLHRGEHTRTCIYMCWCIHVDYTIYFRSIIYIYSICRRAWLDAAPLRRTVSACPVGLVLTVCVRVMCGRALPDRVVAPQRICAPSLSVDRCAPVRQRSCLICRRQHSCSQPTRSIAPQRNLRFPLECCPACVCLRELQAYILFTSLETLPIFLTERHIFVR